MIRIVKMTFKEDKVDEFLKIFNQNKNQIRNFEGVEALELLNDKDNSNIFFTYSTWKSEEHLNNYRNSALFNTVWNSTKVLFSGKAEAWSVEKVTREKGQGTRARDKGQVAKRNTSTGSV